MIWTESAHCLSRVHCISCRKDEKFRTNVGAPEVCPFNITPGQFFRTYWRKKGCTTCNKGILVVFLRDQPPQVAIR